MNLSEFPGKFIELKKRAEAIVAKHYIIDEPVEIGDWNKEACEEYAKKPAKTIYHKRADQDDIDTWLEIYPSIRGVNNKKLFSFMCHHCSVDGDTDGVEEENFYKIIDGHLFAKEGNLLVTFCPAHNGVVCFNDFEEKEFDEIINHFDKLEEGE
jgi:hypothetical protein